MQAGLPGATLTRGSDARRASIAAAGLAALLLVAVIVRFTVPSPHPWANATASDPVATSQAWLNTHDYRLLAQYKGLNEVNIVAVRRGAVMRGSVQTIEPGEQRQTGFFRFRVSATGAVKTSGDASDGSGWATARQRQARLVSLVAQPASLIAALKSTGPLRDYGDAGDARVYRSASGDTLFMVDGRTLGVVLHSGGGEVQTFRFSQR